MTKKRRLETAEAITGTPDLNPPLLMTDEDLLFWFGLLEATLDGRSANSPLQTAPAPPAEGVSEGRREFNNMIFRIADRIAGQPPAPVPPLVLSHTTHPGSRASSALVPEDDDLTDNDLLKVLRRKLGM